MSKKVLVKKKKLKKLEDFYRLVGSRQSCTYINEKGENCHYLGDDQSKIAILRAMAKLKNKLQKSIETVAVKNDEITRLAIGLKGWKERCIGNTVKESASGESWLDIVSKMATDEFRSRAEYPLTISEAFVISDPDTTREQEIIDFLRSDEAAVIFDRVGDVGFKSELEAAKKEISLLKNTSKGLMEAVNNRGVMFDEVNTKLTASNKKLTVANKTIKAQNLTIDSLDEKLEECITERGVIKQELDISENQLKMAEERVDKLQEEVDDYVARDFVLSRNLNKIKKNLEAADGVMLRISEQKKSWPIFFKSFALASIREYMKNNAREGVRLLFMSNDK